MFGAFQSLDTVVSWQNHPRGKHKGAYSGKLQLSNAKLIPAV
jgi:hypothetical protein